MQEEERFPVFFRKPLVIRQVSIRRRVVLFQVRVFEAFIFLENDCGAYPAAEHDGQIEVGLVLPAATERLARQLAIFLFLGASPPAWAYALIGPAQAITGADNRTPAIAGPS
ncbi:MAG: hypothetical protein CBD27_11245 [Rhodospirillaceae bacterium TMED167]|nr:MAG: hypothetical protein CBD27_11245 [Rhodospirillaceae bacterium TMED167]